MIKKIIIISFVSWMLTGCVAGQYLKLDHNPVEEKNQTTQGKVSITVEDDRNYVLNRNKEDYYIGHYRAGFGNTWDVTTFKKVPLKEQIKSDLTEELSNLGFGGQDSGVNLSISIIEWNFDGYQNGEFWYEIGIKVLNKNNEVIATDTLKDKIVIKGTVMSGAKGGFEREMPSLYDKIIDNIVRSNTEILDALKS